MIEIKLKIILKFIKFLYKVRLFKNRNKIDKIISNNKLFFSWSKRSFISNILTANKIVILIIVGYILATLKNNKEINIPAITINIKLDVISNKSGIFFIFNYVTSYINIYYDKIINMNWILIIKSI